MIHISDEAFADLVQRAVADIPERYRRHLDNVAFLVDDEPTPRQVAAGGGLHGGGVLLGLYEGIPLPRRDGGYSGVVPDVITVFKQAHEAVARSEAELAAQVHETVWHEVAHYFGLGHGQIRAL